jgi:hypothetical protein
VTVSRSYRPSRIGPGSLCGGRHPRAGRDRRRPGVEGACEQFERVRGEGRVVVEEEQVPAAYGIRLGQRGQRRESGVAGRGRGVPAARAALDRRLLVDDAPGVDDQVRAAGRGEQGGEVGVGDVGQAVVDDDERAVGGRDAVEAAPQLRGPVAADRGVGRDQHGHARAGLAHVENPGGIGPAQLVEVVVHHWYLLM